MFSHKILPTVSLSSRMALSLGLAVLGTGSLLFLFPSPALPDFPPCPLWQKRKAGHRNRKSANPADFPGGTPSAPWIIPASRLLPNRR